MRLLMTCDAVGGVWTYAADLARGLAAQGVEVTLAVLGPRLEETIQLSGVEVVHTGLPLDWTAESAAELRGASMRIARLACETGADLVHLNSPALAADAGFDVPVLGVCHSCLATWWAAVKGDAPPPDFRWRIAATARGYAACDVLVAPSSAFVEATFKTYGFRPQLVRNGRALAPAAGGAVVRRLGVVSTGRLWDEGKDTATLDAMAAHLGAPVLALGPCEGPQGRRVTLSHARAVGQVPAAHVVVALEQASVFVSTAVYEPFGLGVLEAAQAGCALVLSDIATFRELWDGAAVFVPPRDGAGFAGAVRALLDNPAEAERRGAAAQARAAHYGLDAMVENMLQAYRALLEPGRTRAGALA